MDWSMGLVDDLFVKPVGLEMLFDGIAQRETPIKRSAVSQKKLNVGKPTSTSEMMSCRYNSTLSSLKKPEMLTALFLKRLACSLTHESENSLLQCKQ